MQSTDYTYQIKQVESIKKFSKLFKYFYLLINIKKINKKITKIIKIDRRTTRELSFTTKFSINIEYKTGISISSGTLYTVSLNLPSSLTSKYPYKL